MQVEEVWEVEECWPLEGPVGVSVAVSGEGAVGPRQTRAGCQAEYEGKRDGCCCNLHLAECS